MFGYKMSEYDKKVYEEELKDFLPENIVDSHTHVWRTEDDRKNRVLNPDYWPDRVGGQCSIEDLEQTYFNMFPDKKVVPVIFGWPAQYLDKGNLYVSKAGREKNYPTLFLTDYDMTPEFLEEEVIKGGFQGLKPYLDNCKTGVTGADADIFDFLPEKHLKVADKYGWKVVLHISKPDRLKNSTNIKQLMEIEQKYPNVKLIVAHIGRAYSPEDIGDAFETLKHTENMMFDFSANTLPLATEKCIEAVGTKRVLFGTDMPIAKMKMYRICENGNYVNVVPRGLYGDLTNAAHMRETDEKEITNFTYEIIRGFKKTAEKLGLNKNNIADIMCNNAARIYGIKF